MRRFGLIPERLPSKMSKAYILINEALIDLKKKYNLTLVEADLFVYWVDAFYGKAILWSVDGDKYPDVIKNHQDHIKIAGATYWGVGFPVRMDEFDLPFELPLPLHGYLYEKGKRVTFHATIEAIESYRKPSPPKEKGLRPSQYTGLSKTYLKLSMLEPMPKPKDVGDFIKWDSTEPVSKPPQNYVQIIEPTTISIEQPKIKIISQNLDFLNADLALKPEDLSFGQLLFEDEDLLKAKIFSALKSGKNVMFVGPPGTGKTEIALCLSQIARKNGYINDYIMTTATSDWTTFDTVGGYVPNKDGKCLEFLPGQFLRCFRDGQQLVNKWLVIDEINRSDIDKAFGKLFTVLSGQKVELHFRLDSGSISILPSKLAEKTEIRDHQYIVPKSWRLLATLNTYDKASLYQMSYAFMRRFAFVHIPAPTPSFIEQNWDRFIQIWEQNISIPANLKPCVDDLKEIWKRMNAKWKKTSVGPAIVKDMFQLIIAHGTVGLPLPVNFRRQFITDAIASYIVPQLRVWKRGTLKF